MTKGMTSRASFELLEDTLDTFGADRTRWPAQIRHELSPFIASSEEAQKRIREAAAFDRLLDQASAADMARQAVVLDAIMKKVERAPRVIIENAPVSKPPMQTWQRWSVAGAALAASLMLGILAGQGNSFGVADDLAVLAGLESTSTTSQQLAQTDDSGGYFEEDLL